MLHKAVFNNCEKRAMGISSFSLIEILVALIIFASGMVLMSRVFVVGKYFIKEAENKSIAMKVANLQMAKYLAYSYSGLDGLIGLTSDTLTVGPNADTTNPRFNWQANIDRMNQSYTDPTTGVIKTVPYINIEIIGSYEEKNIHGVLTNKYVRLNNIVSYPYFHIYSFRQDWIANCGGNSDCLPLAPAALIPGSDHIGEIIVKNKVKCRLQIFYTLQIQGDTSSGSIDPIDTLTTQCYVEDDSGVFQPQEIATVTPITTQPVVNNVVAVDTLLSVRPNDVGHKVRVRWFKTSHGDVRLKYVDIIVVSLED